MEQGNLGVFSASTEPNYGGGGGGVLFGGGGGYGTKGEDADYRYRYKSGNGGLSYGDTRTLHYHNDYSHFYMGSGGGGGYNDGHKKVITASDDTFDSDMYKMRNVGRGGDGGGALCLDILGNIYLERNGKIQCNGSDGHRGMDCGGGGGGSGGSIFIGLQTAEYLTMESESCIQAIGGSGATEQCGDGGLGRIRICLRTGDCKLKRFNIKPRPYLG